MLSRPLIGIESSCCIGQAEPIVSLIFSADCSPISRLWWRRMWFTIASSNSSPAMRSDVEQTMPARARTAISVVPPPMSTTREPRGSVTGRSRPIPAAIGSSIR
jgi:hypothetical protein